MNERPAPLSTRTNGPKVIGGTWAETPRACADCGSTHQHLTEFSDGKARCVPCWRNLLRGKV